MTSLEGDFFSGLGGAWAALLGDLRGRPVAVIGHMRPDGDCVGSQVALCRVLRDLGCEAVCVNHHPVPEMLQPFVGDTPFILDLDLPFDRDWVGVAVDCADPVRVGLPLRNRFPELLGNLDHHPSNPRFARHNLVVTEAAATAHLLAGIFIDHGYPLDPVTAQALYLGLLTDTGSFRYSSVTAGVFRICGLLVDGGADPSACAEQIYGNQPVGRVSLMKSFLESLSWHLDGRVCAGVIPFGLFEQTGTTKQDAEGLVEMARDLAGVEVSLLIEAYQPAQCKGSLRAVDPALRMDQVAARLGGGGHAAAAGFTLDLPLDAALATALEALEEHLKAIR